MYVCMYVCMYVWYVLYFDQKVSHMREEGRGKGCVCMYCMHLCVCMYVCILECVMIH